MNSWQNWCRWRCISWLLEGVGANGDMYLPFIYIDMFRNTLMLFQWPKELLKVYAEGLNSLSLTLSFKQNYVSQHQWCFFFLSFESKTPAPWGLFMLEKAGFGLRWRPRAVCWKMREACSHRLALQKSRFEKISEDSKNIKSFKVRTISNKHIIYTIEILISFWVNQS